MKIGRMLLVNVPKVLQPLMLPRNALLPRFFRNELRKRLTLCLASAAGVAVLFGIAFLNAFISSQLLWARRLLVTAPVDYRFGGRLFHFPSPDNLSVVFDCDDLFRPMPVNNSPAVQAAKMIQYSSPYTEDALVTISANCSLLKEHFFFSDRPLTVEEEQYPLAYTIVVYKSAEQVIRMLSTFYWPQHLYCLTYDIDSGERYGRIMQQVAGCFPNILMPDEHPVITWGGYGVLEAAMNCLRVLTARTDHRWRYHQILSGTTLPLRTNYEMVQIFKALNGSYNAEIYDLKPARKELPQEHPWQRWARTNQKVEMPPGNLTLKKSSFSALFSRAAADFIVSDPIAQGFYDWLNGTGIPDETYWGTIAGNPQVLRVPGGFPRENMWVVDTHDDPFYISRYQAWPHWGVCKGKWVSGSCVFQVDDLPLLINRPELVAHKLYLNNSHEPAAFFCLSEAVIRRTLHQPPFNTSFYDHQAEKLLVAASRPHPNPSLAVPIAPLPLLRLLIISLTTLLLIRTNFCNF